MKVFPTLLCTLFWSVALVAVGPPLYAIYDSAAGGISWKLATLEMLPILLALAFYSFNWRLFALGWLAATTTLVTSSCSAS
jgi:hypothetical protein